MERRFNPRNNDAWTLIELLVVLAVLFVLAAMIDWGPSSKLKAKAQRVQCINNLKQVGFALRMWQQGNGGGFQMFAANTDGAAKERLEGSFAFRRFQVMSNELGNPKTLLCPTDKRAYATNFLALKNENVSYFIGLDATDAKPPMLLSGDRNITNGLLPTRTILLLPPDRPAGWTREMHVNQGNVALADGSAASVSTSGLREMIRNTGDGTNRIAIPE